MKKILIINDNISQGFFKLGLTRLNCQVTSCKTEKALDLFLEENYDYILVVMEKNQDLNPDAFKIYEVIKASLTKNQKILVLGWLKNSDDDYLRLPVSPEEILRAIEA